VYDLLERTSAIAIGGVVENSTILLAGGSAATCRLDLSGRAPVVVKRVERNSPMSSIDAHDRHLREGLWMSELPDIARGYFPKLTVSQCSDAIEVRMQFVPAYTLGELIFQERLSFEHATRFLSRAFATLERLLYVQECDRAHSETYTDKIRRRQQGYEEALQTSISLAKAFTHRCRINGELCRPIGQLLDIVDASQDLRDILTTPEPRLCHGDFIPEDVLVMMPQCEPMFIDPNPLNTDPLVDFSKFVMACTIAYDCAIRDEIFVRYDRPGEFDSVTIGVNATYCNAAKRMQELGAWVLDNARNLVSVDVLPRSRLKPEYIELLASLHALAIPEFHAVVHRRISRAHYFLRSGQLGLERALKRMGR